MQNSGGVSNSAEYGKPDNQRNDVGGVMKNGEYAICPSEFRTAYYYHGTPYLPSYRDKGMFVPPGRDAEAVPEFELIGASASPVKLPLWVRP